MESYRPTYITHTQEFVEYNNERYKALFSVIHKDDQWHLSGTVFNIENIKNLKTLKKSFSDRKDCLYFLGLILSKFKNINMKILTFDEEYDEEFVLQKLDEWL